MIKGVAIGLLLCLLGLGLRASAQELPPPGGWPVRPVTELQVVPEPPGGLVPYRQGRLWGYADTTGRVWIQPQFEQEPAPFGQGLLLLTGAGEQWWESRYGMEWQQPWEVGGGPTTPQWKLYPRRRPPRTARRFLLNAWGEQLAAGPEQALVLDAAGYYQAVERADHPGQPELLGVQPRSLVGSAYPGSLFSRSINVQSLFLPKRFGKPRRFSIDQIFAAQEPLRYSARKVNWLRPKRRYWARGRYGERRREVSRRYWHRSQVALFDERGHRLTAYRYAAIRPLYPRFMLYMTDGTGGGEADAYACRNAGLPNPGDLHSGTHNLRYGLLSAAGRELTPADFLRVRPLGHGLFWVVAPREYTLHYGVLDSLGRYVVPLAPEPLSPTDAAGLLRRRSSIPLPRKWNAPGSVPVEYPDTATVSYLRSDGRPAFPGRFEQAGAFWQGRALVRQHGRYGIIDTLGRWVLPPGENEELSYYNHSGQQTTTGQLADPLRLFDAFDRTSQHAVPADDSVLLLVKRRGAYGLISFHSGRTVIEPCFDERPDQWRGAVYGLSHGEPVVVTVQGQRLRPQVPGEDLPAEVGPYDWPLPRRTREALERTPQGYRTRGGRQLWQD